eukprot:SAG31_NODE_3899_length_3771_cov_58.007898_2_plen_170_part_00
MSLFLFCFVLFKKKKRSAEGADEEAPSHLLSVADATGSDSDTDDSDSDTDGSSDSSDQSDGAKGPPRAKDGGRCAKVSLEISLGISRNNISEYLSRHLGIISRNNISEYLGISQDISEYLGISQDISRHLGISRNIYLARRCTSVWVARTLSDPSYCFPVSSAGYRKTV